MRYIVALLCFTGLCIAADAPFAPADSPKPDKDGFYSLFDGKTMDGWKVSSRLVPTTRPITLRLGSTLPAATQPTTRYVLQSAQDSWKIENGELITFGALRGHLYYDGPVANHDFKNFDLVCKVMTTPKANSGIYFHTTFTTSTYPTKGFEAQINQSDSDPKKTGGLYAIKDVRDTSPAQDNKWFRYEIIVVGKHVVIKVDDKVTCDWTEPTPPAPPKGMDGRVIGDGTIALQGHGPNGETHFKDIKIKPLPDDAR